jgi:adenylate kinase
MILMLGPPGAGKSVQGGLMGAELGYVSISTGVILRNRADAELQARMLTGELVSDEIVQELVLQELRSHKPRGSLILDGFPRNVDQTIWLLEHCKEEGITIECLVHIMVERDVCLKRLSARGRQDDKPEVVELRYREYKDVAAPIIEQLVAGNVPVLTVDGSQNIELVRGLIFSQLDQRAKS